MASKDLNQIKGKKNILIISMGGSSGKTACWMKYYFKDDGLKDRKIQFLFIDAVEYDRQEFPNDAVDENEYLFIGGKNPHKFIHNVISKPELQKEKDEVGKYFAIDNPVFLATLPNYTLNEGAGRKRSVGRLLLYMHKARVKNEIKQRLNRMSNDENTQGVSVILISSCCGGTGSSMFHDIFRQVSSYKNVEVHPVVLGPSLYVKFNENLHSDLSQQMKKNAFAFFEELSVYLKFPNINYSFLVPDGNDAFRIKHILFFDDHLNENLIISSVGDKNLPDGRKFYQWVAKTLSILFGSGTNARSRNTGNTLWERLANMDELVETPYSFGNILNERRPFISLSHYEDQTFLEWFTGFAKIILEQVGGGGTHYNGLDGTQVIKRLLDENRTNKQEAVELTISNNASSSPDSIRTDLIEPFVGNSTVSALVEPNNSRPTITLTLLSIKKALNYLLSRLEGLENSSSTGGFELEEEKEEGLERIINSFSNAFGRFGRLLPGGERVDEDEFNEDESNFTTGTFDQENKIGPLRIQLKSYIANLDIAIEIVESDIQESLNGNNIQPVNISIETANQWIRELYHTEKHYQLLLTNPRRFLVELKSFVQNKIKKEKTWSAKENGYAVPAFLVDEVKEKDDFAVFSQKEEDQQTRFYAYIGLNQRDYSIWTDSELSFIDNYYDHYEKSAKYAFFPHIDKRFTSRHIKNNKVAEYLKLRKGLWMSGQQKSRLNGEFDSREDHYKNLIAYALLAKLMNWTDVPIVLNHVRRNKEKPKASYGYYLKFSVDIEYKKLLAYTYLRDQSAAITSNSIPFDIVIDNDILENQSHSSNGMSNNNKLSKNYLPRLKEVRLALMKTVKERIAMPMHKDIEFNEFELSKIEDIIVKFLFDQFEQKILRIIESADNTSDTTNLKRIVSNIEKYYSFFPLNIEKLSRNDFRVNEIPIYLGIQRFLEKKYKQLGIVIKKIEDKLKGWEGDEETPFSDD